MKKFIGIALIIICFGYLLYSQEKSQLLIRERSFEVQLEKNSYQLWEPIFAKFKCSLSIREPDPNFIADSSIKVNFKGNIQEYYGLSQIVIQGRPETLPTEDSTLQFTSYLKDERINRVDEFFPVPGDYQIQFFIYGISSNIINIRVEEPIGINREAFNFIKNNGIDSAFTFWNSQKKNSIVILEQFLSKYSESVYAESAIQSLGFNYLNIGDLDKAEREFNKLKRSKHQKFTKDAENKLLEIKQRRKYLEKKNQSNDTISGRNIDFNKMTFEVEFNKSNYLLLEPMVVKFRFINKTENPLIADRPEFLMDSRVMVINPKKELKMITSLSSDSGRAYKVPGPLSIFQPSEFYEIEEIPLIYFDFTEPGSYKLKFVLYSENKNIESNVVSINVVTPQGIDKEAFDFLTSNGKDVGFRDLVYMNRDGAIILKDFVERFGNTVYGEYSIGSLGNYYKLKGELDNAQREFEKNKFSRNSLLYKQANTSLDEIAKKKAKMNQPSRPQ